MGNSSIHHLLPVYVVYLCKLCYKNNSLAIKLWYVDMVYDMGIYNIVPLMYVNMDKQSAQKIWIIAFAFK